MHVNNCPGVRILLRDFLTIPLHRKRPKSLKHCCNKPKIELIRRCIVPVADILMLGWSKMLVLVALAALGGSTWGVRSVVAAEADFYVSLRYETDASARRCWDEAEFRRSVAYRVGYDPFREDASVRASIRVGGSARAVDGQVEWRNASGIGLGERKFVAKDGDCVKLLMEMSFAVGLQIDLLRPKASAAAGAAASAESATSAAIPSAAMPPSASRSAAPPSTSPTAASLPQSPRPSIAAEPDRATLEKTSRSTDDTAEPAATEASSHWSMWLGIGPMLGWGIAPSIAANARLFFGVRRNDLSAEMDAEASYPSTERNWDGSGFRQRLIGAGVALCGHHNALSGCVLGKASQVSVTGLGVDQPRSPTSFVVQAGARIAAGLQLGGRWSAVAHLDALGLLTPYTVDLNQVGVWEMPRLGALAGIDVSARFR